MKKPSLLLSLGSLLALPLPVMAAMTELADSELAHVSGQAYVVEFGPFEHVIPDLTERNVVIVSGTAQAIETGYPRLTGLARQGAVTATNVAIVSGKTAVIASTATVPGVGTVVAPVLSFLPTPKISFVE
jgi:hypothetical protein